MGSVPNIVSCAGRCLNGERGVLSDGTQAKSKVHAKTTTACPGAVQELPSLLKSRPEILGKEGSQHDSQAARAAKQLAGHGWVPSLGKAPPKSFMMVQMCTRC